MQSPRLSALICGKDERGVGSERGRNSDLLKKGIGEEGVKVKERERITDGQKCMHEGMKKKTQKREREREVGAAAVMS